MGVFEKVENTGALAEIIREEVKSSEKVGREFAEEMAELREKLEKQLKLGEIDSEKEGLGKTVANLAEWVEKNMTNELHKLPLADVEKLSEEHKLPYEGKVILVLAQIFAEKRMIH